MMFPDSDPATAPANDGPGNAAYQTSRDLLARVQAEERARGNG
jgi:hypothetical protein